MKATVDPLGLTKCITCGMVYFGRSGHTCSDEVMSLRANLAAMTARAEAAERECDIARAVQGLAESHMVNRFCERDRMRIRRAWRYRNQRNELKEQFTRAAAHDSAIIRYERRQKEQWIRRAWSYRQRVILLADWRQDMEVICQSYKRAVRRAWRYRNLYLGERNKWEAAIELGARYAAELDRVTALARELRDALAAFKHCNTLAKPEQIKALEILGRADVVALKEGKP